MPRGTTVYLLRSPSITAPAGTCVNGRWLDHSFGVGAWPARWLTDLAERLCAAAPDDSSGEFEGIEWEAPAPGVYEIVEPD